MESISFAAAINFSRAILSPGDKAETSAVISVGANLALFCISGEAFLSGVEQEKQRIAARMVKATERLIMMHLEVVVGGPGIHLPEAYYYIEERMISPALISLKRPYKVGN